jgi:TRAP-type uncharacterized transport system fused permease subunit
MGMPTSGAYILLATLIVPSLTALGIPKLAAHMFVFYFGVLANVTPPVAIASYTAAGIAKSDAMKTGFEAFRLCLPGFIMPYLFCYGPALIMEGSPREIIQAAITATIGIFAMSCSLERFFIYKLNWVKTILLLAGSLGMMIPGTLTDLVGIVLVVATLIFHFLARPKYTNNRSVSN